MDPNAPEIEVNPAAVDVGNQDVAAGLTSPTLVTILNRGAVGSLVITNIRLAGHDAGQFRVLGPTNAGSLAPNATRTLSLAFDPDTAGPERARKPDLP